MADSKRNRGDGKTIEESILEYYTDTLDPELTNLLDYLGYTTDELFCKDLLGPVFWYKDKLSGTCRLLNTKCSYEPPLLDSTCKNYKRNIQ